MAQGIPPASSPFFGGMPATSTSRTVTNVKSSATSPVAGMVHALALLLVMLAAIRWPRRSSGTLAAVDVPSLYGTWAGWREFDAAPRPPALPRDAGVPCSC